MGGSEMEGDRRDRGEGGEMVRQDRDAERWGGREGDEGRGKKGKGSTNKSPCVCLYDAKSDLQGSRGATPLTGGRAPL